MSTSTAELTLVIRAKNLANTAIGELGTAVEKVKSKAATLAGAFKTAFSGMGSALSIFASDIAHGEDLNQAAIDAGLMMGTVIIGNLGEQMVAKLGAGEVLAKIGAQLAILGGGIGTAIDIAIGVGMAIAPAVIIGALAVAIGAVITDKDTQDKFIRGGKMFVNWLVEGMKGIGQALLDAVSKIPGAIADMIRGIKLHIGPFHLSSAGFTIDAPTLIGGPGQEQGIGAIPHAAGGWAGLNGPEFAMLGEKGPEYVIPNHALGNGGGGGSPVVIQLTVDGKVLGRLVDDRLYADLRRAAPTRART